MSIPALLRADLNLLLCLHILLEEQNVTRAAARLHLSQSAVSKNLAKLREWFDDPLFTRTSHGLQPTSRARSLRPTLQGIIGDIDKLTHPAVFNPELSDRRFNLALVESIYPLLLPQFIGELFQQGPQITLNTHQWTRDSFEKMLSGEIDFGITGKDIHPQDAALTMLPPKGIVWHELYRDYQCCLVRPSHPVLQQEWHLDTYLTQRHVQARCGVDGNDRWLLDFKLAEENKFRDIAICVADFNSAASLATHTDLVFTCPSHFGHLIAQQLNLTMLPLPYDLPPMAYTLFWSEDRDKDPGHHWLRELIISRSQQL
ncbi:LysR family transcriptional regulator [Thaumasiovibrio subtropicus]|uniref:LysR family transcriptional regulator n=1 Tax=Thaumasiovibrio subtropicus TaxID=1891207 RepID=UPI000B34CD94|nr:LysR family transcriptional regulator [Thaumasiovibrio subtropicus]